VVEGTALDDLADEHRARTRKLVNRDLYRYAEFMKPLAELSDVKTPETPWDAPGNIVLTRPLAVRVEDRPGRRYADVSVDSNDSYVLVFIKGNEAVGRVAIGPIPPHRRRPGPDLLYG